VPLSPSSIMVPAKGRWCSAAGKVTAGLAESNGSLPLGGWLTVTCGLTACTPGSALCSKLGIKYGKPLPFFLVYVPTQVHTLARVSTPVFHIVSVWQNRSLSIMTSVYLIMAALRSRCGHYIFALWFLSSSSSSSSSFFSSPNLSHRRLNVYHTCTHGMALVRI